MANGDKRTNENAIKILRGVAITVLSFVVIALCATTMSNRMANAVMQNNFEHVTKEVTEIKADIANISQILRDQLKILAAVRESQKTRGY